MIVPYWKTDLKDAVSEGMYGNRVVDDYRNCVC